MVDRLIDDFEKYCCEVFQSLIDRFGFEVVKTERSRWGADITYQNATTAIKVNFELREFGVFITLYRLIDGHLPEYDSLIEQDGDFENGFSLNDLINLRAPSSAVKQELGRPLTSSDLKSILRQYADALQQCASDVLRGDFQIFTELAKIKLERIRRYRMKGKLLQ